ncbi:MAG: hypothetical protein M1324_03715 [Patescibacteria group bacterium]|nr:hypothetical protein [Patescibacteria group bacterium]
MRLTSAKNRLTISAVLVVVFYYFFFSYGAIHAQDRSINEKSSNTVIGEYFEGSIDTNNGPVTNQGIHTLASEKNSLNANPYQQPTAQPDFLSIFELIVFSFFSFLTLNRILKK